MTDTPVNKQDNDSSLLELFRSTALAMPTSSARTYLKAIAAYETFISAVGECPSTPDTTFVTDWLIDMYRHDMSSTTSLLYLNAISALYSKTGNVTKSFSQLKKEFKSSHDIFSSIKLNDRQFNNLIATTRNAARLSGKEAKTCDIMLYSLLNGCMPLSSVAMLRRDDVHDPELESLDIIERNSSPRRRYIFDLDQSKMTPRQLERHIEALVADFLSVRGLAISGTSGQIIEYYWAHAALRCGMRGSEIYAILGHAPYGHRLFSLYDANTVINTPYSPELPYIIGDMFVDNPMHWYAMRLRPRVSYDDLSHRLDQIADIIDRPELFYPCEEIARRTGRRLIVENRPVIADIIFFRSHPDDIRQLFSHIGDLAWCYTTTGRPGSSYAIIPNAAFRTFQETIGQFTPQYEVASIGSLQPHPNDTVLVIGGPLQGQRANLESIADSDPANTIYRIHLTADNGIEWRVNIDSRLLKRI